MRIILPLAAAAAWLGVVLAAQDPSAEFAQGVVFEDQDADGTRDPAEPGLPGMRVSDGLSITVTDAEGSWQLPRADTAIYLDRKSVV